MLSSQTVYVLKPLQLGGAISLNNVQDGVLAQPEPMAYFPVRLTFADEL